jgi:hypothetical protein
MHAMKNLPVPLFVCTCLVALVTLSACRGEEPEAPPVATPSIALKHERAPAGSVIEATYKFVVADGAKFDQNYRVFVHFLDADGVWMWGDDHNPPVPTTTWKPGQTIEYQRTLFVPVFPYVGETTITLGLHGEAGGNQRRLTLAGEHVGQHAYKVGRLELAPQTENLFSVYKEGWHQAETPEHDSLIEWNWTKQEATLAFRNPRKDALFYLDLDSPGSPHESQQVKVTLGTEAVDEFTLKPKERLLRKIVLPAAKMGTGDMSEIHLIIDKTFVPAQVGAGQDQRVLGVRVFHAYVDAR